jgi:uncharacterized SAM-binding protein YcdF (DUF218 family)
MFFYASKILGYFTTPLSWIIILALLIAFIKKFRNNRKYFFLLVFMIFFFGNQFFGNIVYHWWEIKPVDKKEIPKNTKIAIVLSGFSYYDFELKRIHFNHSCDRIFQTLQLYKEGYVSKILISGGSGSIKRPEEIESIFVKEYLVSIGVNPKDILIEPSSKNTYENAKFTKDVLLKNGYSLNDTFLLVTSGYHMRRSIKCFEKQGLKTFPFAADGRSGEAKIYPDELLIPKTGVFNMWDAIIHEWIGYFTYWITGKI